MEVTRASQWAKWTHQKKKMSHQFPLRNQRLRRNRNIIVMKMKKKALLHSPMWRRSLNSRVLAILFVSYHSPRSSRDWMAQYQIKTWITNQSTLHLKHKSKLSSRPPNRQHPPNHNNPSRVTSPMLAWTKCSSIICCSIMHLIAWDLVWRCLACSLSLQLLVSICQDWVQHNNKQTYWVFCQPIWIHWVDSTVWVDSMGLMDSAEWTIYQPSWDYRILSPRMQMQTNNR